MKLELEKLTSEEDIKRNQGILRFGPICKVVIKNGALDKKILKVVKYIHKFEYRVLPEKQGNDLIYRCHGNSQVDSIIRLLSLLENENLDYIHL